MFITTIAPSLPPAINGVGDYAFILARELDCQHGIKNQFLINDSDWTQSDVTAGFQVDLCKTNPAEFARQLSNSKTVLLHYVNYGYQKRGCPVWLLQGLSLWKAQNPCNRLVTMFHELYAFGPLWTSSFWLSPVQRMLAAQLCRLSDDCITSMQKYADILSGWDTSKAGCIPALPVFSSIGEPTQVPCLVNSRRRMVVFGGKALRSRAYNSSIESLRDACSMLNVDEVVDVGPELDFSLPDIGVPLVAMGKLTPQEIQQILLNSWAGYIDYPVAYLDKSTVFAAYCAHGLVPVLPEVGLKASEDKISGQHFISIGRFAHNYSAGLLQQIATNAVEWYTAHSIQNQVKVFHDQLLSCCGK